MELTAAAAWLNSFFSGYDRIILTVLHAIANPVFTFLARLISLIGEKGIVFFLLALVFMCFPKTRKLGVCIFGAVCCGALFTNIILKDLVQRPRPFNFDPYTQWWADIGAPAEDDWSFPSGHVTAAAAGMVAIRLMKGKKWTVPAVVWIVVMMLARNYLMVHYPSDVLVAALIGIASAFIAWFITKFIFDFLYINRRKSWCALVLNISVPDFAGIPSRLGLTGEYVQDDNYAEDAPKAEEAEEVEEDEGEVKASRRSLSLNSLRSLRSLRKAGAEKIAEEETAAVSAEADTGNAEESDDHAEESAPAEAKADAPAGTRASSHERHAEKPSHVSPVSRARQSSGYQGKHCR